MIKKTPGRLNPPPDQEAFDRLPLERWCRTIEGIYYRLHSMLKYSSLRDQIRSVGFVWVELFVERDAA
jgi:hypothetical protein